ncbi:MgtC family protein [Stieleria neptunia]|uniref:MgtC family protein n=1 Tax=Stieleria neptunia TaxID=2527979 RepID=A0A518I361_9BACT|nr:MgtC family protein [Stieleria neptunia]
MDWKIELMFAVRALVAAALGGFIGWEREWHGREAGIRTYASVALGSCWPRLKVTKIQGPAMKRQSLLRSDNK